MLSSIFAVISTLFILIGAALWTVLVKKSQDVNSLMIGEGGTPRLVGIEVSVGSGIYLLWGAFAASFVSLIPYLVV
jgi:hypothetical protein